MHIALIAAAIVALAVLAFVFARGMGRRRRFRRFVESREGRFSEGEVSELARHLDTLFESEKKWTGLAGQFGDGPHEIYLFDVHERLDGLARATATITELPTGRDLPEFVLREAIPTSESPNERWRTSGTNWEDLPEKLRTALQDRPAPGDPAASDWLLEIRHTDSLLYVGTRDRTLSRHDEWRALLDDLHTLRNPLTP